MEGKKPGYETLEQALKTVEEKMRPFYEGEELSKLPKARARWKRKLTE